MPRAKSATKNTKTKVSSSALAKALPAGALGFTPDSNDVIEESSGLRFPELRPFNQMPDNAEVGKLLKAAADRAGTSLEKGVAALLGTAEFTYPEDSGFLDETGEPLTVTANSRDTILHGGEVYLACIESNVWQMDGGDPPNIEPWTSANGYTKRGFKPQGKIAAFAISAETGSVCPVRIFVKGSVKGLVATLRTARQHALSQTWVDEHGDETAQAIDGGDLALFRSVVKLQCGVDDYTATENGKKVKKTFTALDGEEVLAGELFGDWGEEQQTRFIAELVAQRELTASLAEWVRSEDRSSDDDE